MTKQDMQNKMDELQYAEPFKKELLELWDASEAAGHPLWYYADVGSIVINDLHINNGVGDGVFKIDVTCNDDSDYDQKTARYKDTGVFFYADAVRIRLYDLLPESAFTCKFAGAKWCGVLKNNDGNILITVHK